MEYDIIFAGSGPLHILEALHQKRMGKNVLLLEEKKQPLGAWGTVDHPLFGKVETGCHVMEHYKGVYSFLEKTLHLPFETMKPGPEMIWKNRRLPYDWKWNGYIFKSFISHARKFRFKEFRELKKSNQWKVNLVQGEYKYPKGGSPAMTREFHRLIAEHDLDIRFGTRVGKLRQEKNQWLTETATGNFASKHIQLSSLSSIDEIHHANGILIPEYKKAAYHHFHILAETNLKRPFNYLRVLGDSSIHRISDITDQLEQKLPNGQRFFLVGVFDRDGSPVMQKDVGKYTAALLKKYGNCDDTKILHEHSNSYHCDYHQKETLQEIQNLPGIIHLPSTNFTLSVFHQLHRWK